MAPTLPHGDRVSEIHSKNKNEGQIGQMCNRKVTEWKIKDTFGNEGVKSDTIGQNWKRKVECVNARSNA
jgi:hypothetical protein